MTSAPRDFAIFPVSSVEPLSTTITLFTFLGIDSITCPIDRASLKAGIITSILIIENIYFFNSICCWGTINSSKYQADKFSKARKNEIPKVSSKMDNKVKFNFFLLGSIEH